MKPSEQCKAAGLKSLVALSRITGESQQTLINWHKNKPKLFAVVVEGARTIDAIEKDVVNGKGTSRPAGLLPA